MPERFKGRVLPSVLYAFPNEVTTAVGLMATGVWVLTVPGGGFYRFPLPYLSHAFAILLMLCGAVTLWGLVNYRKEWQAGVEQLGLWMTAAVAVCYALVIGTGGSPTATFVVIVFLSVAVSSAIRARAIRILQLQRLAELEAANALREEAATHDRRTD